MPLAPEFTIAIDGDAIPAALRASIVSVAYTDGIEGADRVEVSIANPSLQWLDHPLLQVDNEFRLSIGYAPGHRAEGVRDQVRGGREDGKLRAKAEQRVGHVSEDPVLM